MNLITSITIITLAIAGLFHFYWAFDGKIGLDRAIPTKDGKALLNPGKILTQNKLYMLDGFYQESFTVIQV